MKKLYLILMLSLFVFVNSNAQITITKVVGKQETDSNKPYDSLDNFLSHNLKSYIGQTLFFPGKWEKLQEYGYEYFVYDYQKPHLEQNNVYKIKGVRSTNYDAIAGKYFDVIDVVTSNESSSKNIPFLKLQEKQDKDIMYLRYDTAFKELQKFITVGYFMKLKKMYLGKNFYVRNISPVNDKQWTDYSTGQTIEFPTLDIWKCKDITVEDKYYELSFILENTNHNKICLEVNRFHSKYHNYGYLKSDFKYIKPTIQELILTGKTKIGMTKNECIMSWGEPESINPTITSNGKSEQWVYSNSQYLYFENGILTAIQ